MRVFVKKSLKDFYNNPDHRDSQTQLESWYDIVNGALWKSPADIKSQFRNASFLANNRVVFNICGNKYRLVVKVEYAFAHVYVRFVGTHKEYDRIDAGTI